MMIFFLPSGTLDRKFKLKTINLHELNVKVQVLIVSNLFYQ